MTDTTEDTEDFTLQVEIAKAAPDGSFVRGWGAVVSVDGKAVIDWEGDVLPMSVLREAVHDYMSGERVAKVMHKGVQIGSVVEGVIIDDDFAEAHGITHGKRGWWVGMAVEDTDVRKGVMRGDYTGFSIGGRGDRVKVG